MQHVAAYEQWDLWDATVTTSPNTTAWRPRMHRGELARTARWSTIASQEDFQITPVLALAPGKPQSPYVAAFSFALGLTACINDQPD